jgi:biotin synthase
MSDEETIAVVACMADSGIKTVVVQSGEDPALNALRVCRLVERIKSTYDIAVTLSLGEYSREDYASMRSAGADRYLLRHETSDNSLYAALHPDSSRARRLNCLEWIKEAGLQTGAGMMIGLPGQTIDSIAEDILFMKSLGVHMAGIGPFIPDPDTPLGYSEAGDFDLAMRTLAAARIAMPHLLIPATTATGVLRQGGRARALKFGANVIMVNATPDNFRELYKIYPNKDRDEPYSEDPFKTAREMIISEGRVVSEGYGHSPIICETQT